MTLLTISRSRIFIADNHICTTTTQILASLRASLSTPATTSAVGGTALNQNAVASNTYKLKEYPFPPLNDLLQRHFKATQSAPLAVSGRHLQLLYTLIATLIAPPHNKAVLVVDMDGRFDITRVLDCAPFPATVGELQGRPSPAPGPADLNHVHVTRPARGSRAHTAEAIASAQNFMLYAAHGSRSREWWGTIVVGGGLNPAASSTATATRLSTPTVDVTAAWKGWLRVDRPEIPGFGVGVSVEEACAARETRAQAVDAAGWVASSVWGGFAFGGQGHE